MHIMVAMLQSFAWAFVAAGLVWGIHRFVIRQRGSTAQRETVHLGLRHVIAIAAAVGINGGVVMAWPAMAPYQPLVLGLCVAICVLIASPGNGLRRY